ncbi:hypothetical protein WAI453_011987 [Rhynchosporium graminicola]
MISSPYIVTATAYTPFPNTSLSVKSPDGFTHILATLHRNFRKDFSACINTCRSLSPLKDSWEGVPNRPASTDHELVQRKKLAGLVRLLV